MRKPIASARPGVSLVMITDTKTGRRKYHVSNRSVVCHEKDGNVKCKVINNITKTHNDEVDIWDLAKRRYRRTIRLFREEIDSILKAVYTNLPEYRDCDISAIMLEIRKNQSLSTEDLASCIFNVIHQQKQES